eukprot:6457410-Amphidinium_carterae.2
MQRLLVELHDLAVADCDVRRRQLRLLQLELHPDKQPVSRRIHAQQLFLLVQEEWEKNEAARKRLGRTMATRAEGAQKASQQDLHSERRTSAAGRGTPPPQKSTQPPSQSRPAADKCFEDALRTFDWNMDIARKQEMSRRRQKTSPDNADHCGMNSPSSHVEVNVSGLTLEMRKEMNADDLVADVKQALEQGSEFKWEWLRLALGSRELSDHERLGSLLGRAGSLRLTVIVCEEFSCDYASMWRRVQGSWRELQHASTAIRTDRSILMLALEQDWRVLNYVPVEILAD